MSQFRTMDEDLLETIKRHQESTDRLRYTSIDVLSMRYPGMARVDVVDRVLDLVAKGKLERRDGDWRVV
jgi:hypothetical protein